MHMLPYHIASSSVASSSSRLCTVLPFWRFNFGYPFSASTLSSSASVTSRAASIGSVSLGRQQQQLKPDKMLSFLQTETNSVVLSTFNVLPCLLLVNYSFAFLCLLFFRQLSRWCWGRSRGGSGTSCRGTSRRRGWWGWWACWCCRRRQAWSGEKVAGESW